MATWRANPALYGEGGGEYVDDTGQIWPDPWGTLNAPLQATAPVPMNPPPAPAQGGGGPLGAPPAGADLYNPRPVGPPVAPGAHADPAQAHDEARTADLQQLNSTPPDPAAARGSANRSAGAQAPTPTPGFADQAEPVTTSGSTSESGSTGLSPQAQARAGANITAVAGQKNKAVEETAKYNTLAADQAAARSATLIKDAADNIAKNAAEIAVNDHIQSQVNQKMQNAADWRPDRTELFHGDNGAAFGLGAAVAAMAGAWMQGRGLTGQNPYLPTIMKMIDDNVSDQVRRNSGVMQYLKDQKGDLKGAMLELKQRQLHYAQQRLDGLAMKDSSDLMRAGVEKTRADMQAQNAQWEQEKRQAIERTQTSKVTKTLSSTNKPAGSAMNGQARDELNTIRTGRRILDQWKTAQKSGTADNYLGWQSKTGLNWLSDAFGGLPHDQQQFANSLKDYNMFVRDLMRREPNGGAGQALSEVGEPKNDRDMAVAVQRLESILNDREASFRAAPPPAEDPTVGAY